MVDARESGVHFCVAVVVEMLLAFPELGIQDHDALFADVAVFVMAESAVIHQLVAFGCIADTYIQFVVTTGAKSHAFNSVGEG